MSLYDAVSEIVDDMQSEYEDHKDGAVTAKTLKGFIRQLRTALKAAGNEPSPSPVLHHVPLAPMMSSEVQHFRAVDEARKEFRKSKLQEEGEIRACLLVGGPGDGTSVPIHTDMKPGDRTGIFNAVYELQQDQRLHFIGGSEKAPPEQKIHLG